MIVKKKFIVYVFKSSKQMFTFFYKFKMNDFKKKKMKNDRFFNRFYKTQLLHCLRLFLGLKGT